MSTIKVGDTIPSGTFKYVPWDPALEEGISCGIPSDLKTDGWKGKKVVVIAVPGAFTPTCHVNHIPPFVEKYEELKGKVDAVYVLSGNDVYVMSAWARSQGFKDKITALADLNSQWSQAMGMSLDLTEKGMGIRPKRYALIVDDLKVVSIEVGDVPVTGVEAVLSKL